MRYSLKMTDGFGREQLIEREWDRKEAEATLKQKIRQGMLRGVLCGEDGAPLARYVRDSEGNARKDDRPL
jgi:hypothetical protein